MDEIKSYVDDLKTVLNSASVLEQKAFLRSFVKRINVSKSDVTINYTLPMTPMNDYRETVGVLGFKQNGGRYSLSRISYTPSWAQSKNMPTR